MGSLDPKTHPQLGDVIHIFPEYHLNLGSSDPQDLNILLVNYKKANCTWYCIAIYFVASLEMQSLT